MPIEIESTAELERQVATGSGLVRCVVKDLDLRASAPTLDGLDLAGAVFLGCHLASSTLQAAQQAGALVFPVADDLPFDPYRTRLYTSEDLYAGFVPDDADGYRHTLDARIDRWGREPGAGAVLDALWRRLHDHAITEALADVIVGQDVVGVMGGHPLPRDDPEYAVVAHLGRDLQRAGFLVATGGGPGAMEAANLGAFCGPHPDGVLDQALVALALAPRFTERDGWLAAALGVRDRWREGAGTSLGIPTWHYGHEPPTPFATHIAKYFENSVREDGLLTIATAGIVFTRGGSGTVQELFQDGSQNCYAVAGGASPMVLFGRHFWTEEVSAERPLRQLAAGRPAASLITLTDDPAEAVAAMVTHRDARTA